MKKVAINGFGRIGRIALRMLLNEPNIEVVAINDLTDSLSLAYLFKYDTVHRTLRNRVSYDEKHIYVGDKTINIYSEKEAQNLPWRELGIDIVLECSGAYTSKEKCMEHIKAGAKKVIISAPSKDECKTIVYNVNDKEINVTDDVISTASCTTNCLAPVLYLLNKYYKINKGFMSTVHAITNDQAVMDVPHKKGIASRRGRAGAFNIIPTSTGAASAIGKVLPELDGKMKGVAFRVPVQDGSLIDVTVEVNGKPSKEEINRMFKDNQNETLKIVNTPIVSSDVIGETSSSIVDADLTEVLDEGDKTLIKVVAWYDNEVSYTAQMIRTMKKL